jgi:hypothetical protein
MENHGEVQGIGGPPKPWHFPVFPINEFLPDSTVWHLLDVLNESAFKRPFQRSPLCHWLLRVIVLIRAVPFVTKTTDKTQYNSAMADRSHQAALATHPPGIVVEMMVH